MQRANKTSSKNKFSLQGIPTGRRHFYFYALLALVAVLGNRAIKGDSVEPNEANPSGKSHMANVADNTRLAYQ